MRSFLDFIASSPSSFHAAHQVARRLNQAGFAEQDEAEPWDASPGGHYVVRGGAIMAWWVPENASPESGFRIVGSHTDSPGFKVKPGTDFTTAGWQQVAVEVYGGPILTSWFDRELVLAGRVILSDGSEKMVATGPLLRIPNLAIHLSRDKAQDTSTLSRQVHLQPVMGVGDPEASALDVVAASAGVDKHDIVAHDLITCDAQRGEMFGANMDLVAAGRLDNLSSVYASLEAFIAALQSGDAGNDVLVLAAFDHEEVGSATISGAAGPLLENVLVRTAQALKADTEDLHRMFARSWCVSADAAHSVHPNYVGKHDPVTQPLVNHGPVVKMNANQRYASDAVTWALWERACRDAGVSSQVFVGNNDSPCGSTIGPITATRLGIRTVDVGIALLSMHSARELCGAHDMGWFAQALEAFFVGD